MILFGSAILLLSGCDIFKRNSASEKSCTKIMVRSLGILIDGLSEEELSKLELKLKDGGIEDFSRNGNAFSSHSSARGKMHLVGKLGAKELITKDLRIKSDEQGCHASPQSLRFVCSKGSGVLSCVEVAPQPH